MINVCRVACSGSYIDHEVLYLKPTPSVWDIIQGAFIVHQAGGSATYDNGILMFPFNMNLFDFTQTGSPRLPSVIVGAQTIQNECLSFNVSINIIFEQKIKDIALHAGAIMQQIRSKKSLDIRLKKDNSIVTNADLKIQEVLDKYLSQLPPGSIIIGEKSVNSTVIRKAQSSRYVWVVDPIDGTDCYATKDKTEFGVAIALLDKGIPVYSLFYAPELNIGKHKGCLFEASVLRQGAFLNNEKINVRDTEDLTNALCNIHTRDDYPQAPFENPIINLFGEAHTQKLKKSFSTSARYCMLAASGNYPHLPILLTKRIPKIWDVIPGAFILQKAGDSVFFPDGNSIFPFSFNLLLKDQGDPRIPSNIACPKKMRLKILGIINNKRGTISSGIQQFVDQQFEVDHDLTSSN